MERRGQERELGIPNSMGYQEATVKLPLAPLMAARGSPLMSARRGSSIFSPSQTLDQPYNAAPPSPPPPHLSPSPPPQLVQREPSPDPDPPLPSVSAQDAADVSNSMNPAPPPPPQAATAAQGGGSAGIKYRECLKNHAASKGGHVVDGCGEFMPSGDDGTPESLLCAACDCHRSFHRKEVEGEPPQYYPYIPNHAAAAAAAAQPIHGQFAYSMPPHHHRHHHKHFQQGFAAGSAPPAMVNFASGAAAESSSEDLNIFQSGGGGGHAVVQPSSKSKRFRTKFSQDQKDRMQEFASKIGWRIQKQDEQEVQQFCSEVGVKRQVFKVWMHNNKQAMKKRQT